MPGCPHAPANHAPSPARAALGGLGEVVLVLQGGGALGAYHGGVYEALVEAGIEPDWVIGTSIGAINGSLIAGNRQALRLERLREFWRLIEYEWPLRLARAMPFFGQAAAAWMMTVAGNPEFFLPNPRVGWDPARPVPPEQAGFYTVEPLRQTLDALIEADEFGRWPTRLTVGAAQVRTARMVYFDSAEMFLDLDHVLASGALPPAFPPVRIGGELYWDGGVLSNTPIEFALEQHVGQPALIFEVQLWDAQGAEPTSINQAMTREKDLRFASRAAVEIERHKELRRLRKLIADLCHRADTLDELMRARSEQQACEVQIHIVRLLAPRLPQDGQQKYLDFSRESIAARWAAGLADMRGVLAEAPWTRPVDPDEGIIVHETQAGVTTASR
jgi:NTE family protein